MIIYRKEPIPIQMTNVMLLEDEVEGGYVYVDKNTYDQASAIFTRFDGDFQIIWKSNKSDFDSKEHPELFKVVQKWKAEAPEPLNALLFAFSYLKDTKGVEWENISREDMYGFMHELSMMVDFNAMTLVPTEVRANIKIPKLVLMSYNTSWDSLLNGLENKVALDERPESPRTMADMSPEEFTNILKVFINKLSDSISSINISAPVVQQPIIQQPVQPQPTYVQQAQATPLPIPTLVKEVQPVVNEEPDRELSKDEQKDASIWNVDWAAAFAAADEEVAKEKASGKKESSNTTSTTKDTINGTPVATYDSQKANDSNKVLASFGADF